MAGILDHMDAPAKILLIGKSGAGKTGSLASLVAAGYNLRIIDTDKGIRPLQSLLTDSRYPYIKTITDKGIDLNQAVRYISIDTSMKLQNTKKRIGDNKFSVETLLAPNDARAWGTMLDALDNWREGDVSLGSVRTWTANDILVFDSFSTLAKCAYYFSQSLNGRLGARDNGFDYQRDIGEAQSQLTRLLELLYDSGVPCNVIVISHITWVDDSRGIANRPDGTNALSAPDGYPSAIGRALSPQMGKYFNDVYIVSSSGTGASVKRAISTVSTDGVIAKNSVYLERSYDITDGLAKIFAALRRTEPKPHTANGGAATTAPPLPSPDPRPAPVGLVR